MASIPVKPRLLRNYLLQVDTDNYEAACDSVTFTPSSSTQTWTGGDGEAHSDAAASTWGVALGYMQDWDTVGSLGEYLLEHEGEVVPVTFTPNRETGGTGPTFTADVTIVPGAIGGSNGAWPTTTSTMPCSKPVLTRPGA